MGFCAPRPLGSPVDTEVSFAFDQAERVGLVVFPCSKVGLFKQFDESKEAHQFYRLSIHKLPTQFHTTNLFVTCTIGYTFDYCSALWTAESKQLQET
jgi:hypothetical protein